MIFRLKFFVCAPLLVWLLATNAFCQLSPGELHRAHIQVEKLKNCTKCHDADRGINPALCLDCHRVLQARINAAKGLHAQPDHRNCENCHVEHQGRDGELILWKESKEKFDHKLTGYALIGKHAGPACEKCHKPEFIVDAKPLLDEKIDLKKTLLGLKEDCLTCHIDEHRGALAPKCLDCHGMDGWKPAPSFNHDRTAYPLTGKHHQVGCERCHPSVTDKKFKADDGFIRYKGLSFKHCSDCHQDVHKGRLSGPCESCHTVEAWQKRVEKQFDHAKTNYPLLGKHAAVPCEKCHLPGKTVIGIPYKACSDCHKDEHQGQFAKRTDRGACESCHTVGSFSPAVFTQADHQKTRYPLQGAHLAVACLQCHDKTFTSGSARTFRFVFPDQSCGGCHADVHKGTVNDFLAKRGCENCHKADAWSSIEFEHNRTKFKLEGAHAATRCSGCHKTILIGTANERIQFKNVKQNCIDCHEDIHLGQFRQRRYDGSSTSAAQTCSHCHGQVKWQLLVFDHNRDSVFKLDGAHKKLTCVACHRKEMVNGQSITRYAPLGKMCKDCHGNSPNVLYRTPDKE